MRNHDSRHATTMMKTTSNLSLLLLALLACQHTNAFSGTLVRRGFSTCLNANPTNRQENDDDDDAPRSSRRGFLGHIAATGVILTAVPRAAKADPSSFSSLQGPLQDSIAPGHWIGQFLGLNSRTVTWTIDSATPADVSRALVDTLNGLSPERKTKLYMPNFEITQADANRVHVMTWTKKEWLDSLDVQFTTAGGGDNGGTVATASFYATGVFPTWVPGAPFINIALFFIPFASPGPREMLQDFRLRALEGLLRKQLAS